MKDESKSQPGTERSSLALVGEWGITLAVVTTLGALGGYWLGTQIHHKVLTMIFVLVGIWGGFTLGIKRMLKVTNRYVNGLPHIQAKPAAQGSNPPAATDNRHDLDNLPLDETPNWDEMKDT